MKNLSTHDRPIIAVESFKASKKTIHAEIAKVVSFMEQKYPEVDFKKVRIWYRGGGKSHYNPSTKTAKIGRRCVWYTYRRATVGLMTPKTGIYVGYHVKRQISLTHELTHYAQHMEGRKYSEVETTVNEIEYMRAHYPEYCEKLVPVVMDKKRKTSKTKKRRIRVTY